MTRRIPVITAVVAAAILLLASGVSRVLILTPGSAAARSPSGADASDGWNITELNLDVSVVPSERAVVINGVLRATAASGASSALKLAVNAAAGEIRLGFAGDACDGGA